jgi:hypothetical protein
MYKIWFLLLLLIELNCILNIDAVAKRGKGSIKNGSGTIDRTPIDRTPIDRIAG